MLRVLRIMDPLKYVFMRLEYVIVRMDTQIINTPYVKNVMQVIIILELLKHLYVQVRRKK